MLLHISLTSLLIVVCARAQLLQQQQLQQQKQQQQPLYPSGDRIGPNLIPPSRVLGGGNTPGSHEDQSGLLRSDDVLSSSSEDKVHGQSSSPSLQGQATNALSRGPRSDRLWSLHSSLRHVLTATSLAETRRRQLVGQPSQNTASSSGVLHARPSSDNSEYQFPQDEDNTANGTSSKRHIIPSPAIVPLVPQNQDSSSLNNMSSDHEPVTLSSLLKDVFLERNPTTLPGYFTGGNNDYQQEDLVESTPEDTDIDNSNNHELPGPAQQPFFAQMTKRDRESVPEHGASSSSFGTSQQSMHNDSHLSVQERSWRCSIPDVLIGDGDLPWTCHQRWAWRFLGEHVYPSRVYEAVCEGRTCWYGHFNCTPITYTLHVLELCLHGCQDQRVPFPLRSFWQWTDLNVTVGCQCVR